MFCLVPDAESLLVHNLVCVGIVCRNTSCGLSGPGPGLPFPLFGIQLTIFQVFLVLDLSGVLFFVPPCVDED
jgi:hypothetical protein